MELKQLEAANPELNLFETKLKVTESLHWNLHLQMTRVARTFPSKHSHRGLAKQI